MNLYGKFVDEYGKELLEIIAETLWSGEDYEPVVVHNIHEINRTNHTISGLFKHEGKDIYFSMDMGDQDGTYIHYYGEEYQEPKHARTVWKYEIVSTKRHSKETLSELYKAVESSEVLQKILKDYAYDMYVTGNGAKFRNYYRRKLDMHPWGKDLDFVSETIYE